MIVSLMVYAVVASLLIAGGARGLEEGLRAFGLPARFVWLLALVVTVGLAAIAPLRGGATSPAVGEPTGTEVLEIVAGDFGATMADARSVVRKGVEAPLRSTLALDQGAFHRALPMAWIGLSLLALLIGIATHLWFRRVLRRLPLAEVDGVPVRIAPTLGPAVLGLRRPQIVVPRWLLGSAPEERRLVLLHEREHLAARDHLLLAAGCVVTSLLVWNPIAWWMFLRLRLAIEVDCDTRVLRQGVRPATYGSMLIDVSGHAPGVPLGIAAIAGFPSNLERRLRSMTRRITRAAMVRGLLLGVVGIVLLLAACEARLPPAAEIRDLDVASAQVAGDRFGLGAEQGRRLYLVADSIFLPPFADQAAPPLVVIDGRVTDAAELRRVDPGTIRSVSVLKGQAAAERYTDPRAANGVIVVTTGSPSGASPSAPQMDSRALEGAPRTDQPTGARDAPEFTPYPLRPRIGLANPSPAARDTPVVEQTGQQPLSDQPVFTPYDERPRLLDAAEFTTKLDERYPSHLREAEIEGQAVFWLFITDEGTVGNVRLVTGAGHAEFDQAAESVLREARFEPARNRGVPVPVWIQIPVSFRVR